MATKIQLRRDTAANWAAENPVLSEGELGYDTTNAKAKIGDGVQGWTALPFITDSASTALIPGDDVSLLVNNAGYLTTHQSLAGYATETWVGQQGYLTTHQDLSDYATQQWVGDQNYLTTHQDLTGYATEAWVGTQGYLTAHQDISSKADITYVDNAVFSGDYNDLSNTPTVGFETKVLEEYVEQSSSLGTFSGTTTIDPANGSIQYGTASGDFTITPSQWFDGQSVSIFANGTGTRTMTMSGSIFANDDKELDGNSIVNITRTNGTYWVSISKGYTA